MTVSAVNPASPKPFQNTRLTEKGLRRRGFAAVLIQAGGFAPRRNVKAMGKWYIGT